MFDYRHNFYPVLYWSAVLDPRNPPPDPNLSFGGRMGAGCFIQCWAGVCIVTGRVLLILALEKLLSLNVIYEWAGFAKEKGPLPPFPNYCKWRIDIFLVTHVQNVAHPLRAPCAGYILPRRVCIASLDKHLLA